MEEQKSPSTLKEKVDLLFYKFKLSAMTDSMFVTKEQLKWSEGYFLLQEKKNDLTIESLCRFADYVCTEISKDEPDTVKEFLLLSGIDELFTIPSSIDSCKLGNICSLVYALRDSEEHNEYYLTMCSKINNFLKSE